MKHTENEILEALKSKVKSEDLTKTLPWISEALLNDFFNRVSYLLSNSAEVSDSRKSLKKKNVSGQLNTSIFIDGASDSNANGGIGVVLRPIEGEEILISRGIGKATNNEAEYRSLITAIEESLKNNFNNIEINSDSELLVKQVNGKYKVRAANLKPFYDLVMKSIKKFDSFTISWVPREENSLADELAKKGSKLLTGVSITGG